MAWLPGLTLAIAVAVSARLAARFVGTVPDVVLALLPAIALSNLFALPAAVRPGISFVLHCGKAPPSRSLEINQRTELEGTSEYCWERAPKTGDDKRRMLWLLASA
jgi:hypothetical protein